MPMEYGPLGHPHDPLEDVGHSVKYLGRLDNQDAHFLA